MMRGRLHVSVVFLVAAVGLGRGPALRENVAGAQPASIQPPVGGSARSLIGTWTLISAERLAGGSGPTTIPGPRGMLVFDAAGHTLEVITRGNRPIYAAGQPTAAEAQVTLASYGGFWGSYRTDGQQGRITCTPEGAVNPNVMGKDLVRSFESSEDRLTITALPSGSAGERGMRWLWQRVPDLETLSPAHQRLVGFWQHVVERRENATTGAVISETRRAPSIIAYTAAGYVGVHFVPLGRQPFEGDTPTDEEARAAIAGYVGYYGVYSLHPGVVFHHRLAVLSPGQIGDSLRRPYEISGAELNLRFPPVMNQGELVRTVVTLRRLGSASQ
jgi:Lipocalin-like domain